MSHHFLCNYRLTLYHVAFRTFCTRSIGWALFGVNFRPLQEIETIMGGGRTFDTGPFFARLRYMTKVKWGNSGHSLTYKFTQTQCQKYTVNSLLNSGR